MKWKVIEELGPGRAQVLLEKVFKNRPLDKGFFVVGLSSLAEWVAVGFKGDGWHEPGLAVHVVVDGHEATVGKEDVVFTWEIEEKSFVQINNSNKLSQRLALA